MREQEGLQALGKKTEYKSDYAPEVLETFQNTNIPRMITGCNSIARSLRHSVQLPDSPISRRSRSSICQVSGW